MMQRHMLYKKLGGNGQDTRAGERKLHFCRSYITGTLTVALVRTPTRSGEGLTFADDHCSAVHSSDRPQPVLIVSQRRGEGVM